MAHRTLAGPVAHEDVVKGSRFAARIAPVARAEDAAAEVAAERSAHPDAHHVCWALLCGDVRRWSDDGEPGGTAGRPMLEVLDKRGVDRVVATVARRFGGVKLGAGGLARAYAGAVARALDAATVVDVPDRDRFRLEAPFADADALLRALQARADVALAAPAYGATGIVLTGTVLRDTGEALGVLVADLTRGRARWSRTPVPDDGADQRK